MVFQQPIFARDPNFRDVRPNFFFVIFSVILSVEYWKSSISLMLNGFSLFWHNSIKNLGVNLTKKLNFIIFHRNFWLSHYRILDRMFSKTEYWDVSWRLFPYIYVCNTEYWVMSVSQLRAEKIFMAAWLAAFCNRVCVINA